MYWILDFDDTLAVGPNTWALETVLPQLIKDRNLPYQKALFDKVILETQEKANNHEIDDAEVFQFVFDSLSWPGDLRSELEQKVYKEYQPSLYADTKPFLEKLKAAEHTIIVISNNNHAPQIAEALGIADYFDAIYTPNLCDNAPPKPQRHMWDYVSQHEAIDTSEELWVVGDDPWSDGSFAEACGLMVWILDRLKRYESLYETMPYQWAETLTDITI
jgi:FMN phosphatase YigB (HAD superfamily)